MMRLYVTSLFLLISACGTSVGAGDASTLPDDVAQTCTDQCESLGLDFDGVAVGKRSVDCICEPDD
jgi:hypothetical protein